MFQDLAASAGVTARAGAWLYIAEIEHRVANEYALAVASISLAAASCSDTKVKAALGGAAQRLRDYADVHRALQAPLKPDTVDLAIYLRRLSDAIARASLSERGVQLILVDQSVEIDAQRCWRVGLIVSELITNAVRHGLRGGPGVITLEIARSAGLVQCLVSDDGHASVGAPPGTGTLLVNSLADELGGFVVRRASHDGTCVVLSFPELGGAGVRDVAARKD